MLSRTKRELRKTEDEIRDTAKAAQKIIEDAAKEGRSRTDDENAEVAEYHKKLDHLNGMRREFEDQLETEQKINDSVGAIDVPEEDEKTKGLPFDRLDASTFQVKTIGEQFVESEAYKSLVERTKAGNGVPQNMSTGPVEVKAGTLFETGQGAGLIPVPQVVPGQVEKLFQRVTIADVLPSGQATSNSIRYVVEGTATEGATAVAEGGTKPASDLALSTVDEPVQKIATILTVSDEMVEDVPAVTSYINGRLGLFVRIEEEDQLIRGDGTSPNISGFYDRAINTYGAGTVDDNAIALFKAINNTRGSSFLDVDHIFMHPDNWQATRLLQDDNGQFYGGGPFSATGAYGTGNMGQASRFGMDSLWNVPVTITTATGSGTALVGAFQQGAQLWRRGGLTVEATNAHSDYFIKNLVAIRAEQREALAVYRPAAFTKVTGLD